MRRSGRIIERFFSEAIPAAKEPGVFPVVQREGPHAVEPVRQARAPFAVAVQEHFTVGMVCLKKMAAGFQFRPELGVVVDLAVKNKDEIAIDGGHRLMPAFEIDDGKAAMAEKDGAVAPESAIVRPAMSEAGGHARQRFAVDCANETGDAAHSSALSKFRSGAAS